MSGVTTQSKTKKGTPTKRWIIHPQNIELAQRLGECLELPTVIAQLLLNRNIKSLNEAQAFINPDPACSEQFFPEQTQQIIELLKTHIQAKNPILVYGDYDVDGMTSTAMMVAALRDSGAKVDYYIPHRFTEGYGLTSRSAEAIIQKDFGCLITLDCGISSAKEIEFIKEKTNADIIILDHHKIPEKVPNANVIINPMELKENDLYYHCCTAGIVYLLLHKCAQDQAFMIEPTQIIDLAACGTVADVASLKGLNRAIVKSGLVQLSKRTRPGIKYILENARCEKSKLDSFDIGFVIAPRLNAAGRLTHAKEGVACLLETDPQKAQQLAMRLEKLNQERRQIGEQMQKEASSALDDPEQSMHNSIVLAGKGWHSGIIGITASRLADTYSKPSILIAYDDTIGRGSARSIGEVNVYEVIKACSEYLETFGGHSAAAGFSIKPQNIKAFKQALLEQSNNAITPEELRALVEVDAKLLPSEMNLEMAKQLHALEPFGQHNPQPIFYTNELIPIDMKTVGEKGTHLKATFTDKNETRLIDAIGFGLAHKLHQLYNKQVELLFNLEINYWQGVEKPQLKLIDIK